MSDRVYNFASGPATLPEPVLRKAQEAIWNLDGTGIGVLEHSHRGAAFTRVIERAEALLRELGGISDEHAVMFLQGGASAQFFMVPMNLLSAGATADYVATGTWSQKAIAEAQRFGAVHVAGSTETSNFASVPGPGELTWTPGAAYAHFTSNETIHGVQWATEPTPPPGVPLICDASSDLFSKPIDVNRYGLIYAGAQKNLGPSGLVVVIARRDLIAGARADLPTLLRYRTHEQEHSLHNTPPTFAVYVLAEVLEWLKARGGLEAMAAHNQAKARLIYDVLDDSTLYLGHARVGSRSLMNVTFRLATPALEQGFLAACTQAGLDGLKGHRSVGGVRASIYNAMPIEGVERLVEVMRGFERDHAGAAAAVAGDDGPAT